MRRLPVLLSSMFLFTQVHAFPCYITMIKDNCWSEYNVNVDVIDVATDKVVASMSMPKGKAWDRKEIVCQPKQTVSLKASFSPTIWAKDEGKTYEGKRFWSFPEEIKEGESAWNMVICYSNDIQGVPTPPDVSGACVCDKQGIPVIQPH